MTENYWNGKDEMSSRHGICKIQYLFDITFFKK